MKYGDLFKTSYFTIDKDRSAESCLTVFVPQDLRECRKTGTLHFVVIDDQGNECEVGSIYKYGDTVEVVHAETGLVNSYYIDDEFNITVYERTHHVTL